MNKTYDSKKVIMICGGFPLTGYADGTFVSVDRNEDAFTLSVGADGESTRSKTNNRSGTFTFDLQQASSSNAILSGFHLLDERANAGKFPVLIKDGSGNSLCSAEVAWIKKVPNSEFGKEAGSRQWVIESDNIEIFVGGNNQ